jgi:hypothetical protein
LYFDGAISYFSELPKADDRVGMQKVYNFIENNKKKKSSVLMLMVNKLTKFLTNNDSITNRKKCSN